MSYILKKKGAGPYLFFFVFFTYLDLTFSLVS